MPKLLIDGRDYEVSPGQNVLQASLSLGFDLPYFCWHPALGSVGACRQCAVKQFKDENDDSGKIVMACMTPAKDGTRVSLSDPEAAEFRAHVIEWLMLNHPHDCPVCDEGGECHLQDMTVMAGHVVRRTRFPKRTFRSQYLGPFIHHEMNRCIECYRCVRFYRDYAGGRDLDVFGAHDHVYFGRQEDGVLESEFAGNLVEVCPTGVFTDKTSRRHYTRKWDLSSAPSICAHCGWGCNVLIGERYETLRRVTNRFNSEVNGYFLCDRGRFGYEFVNDGRRVRQPRLREAKGSPSQTVSKAVALERARGWVATGRILGIGSPRASVEANFALQSLVGPERFVNGLNQRETGLVSTMMGVLKGGPAHTPTLHDVEDVDAVLILGEDVAETAPRLALAVRQAVTRSERELASRADVPLWHDAAVRSIRQDAKGPLFVLAPYATRLDDLALECRRAAPDDLARIGFAVAHAVDGGAPAAGELDEADTGLVGRIAERLQAAEHPLVIAGPGLGNEALIHAAANVAWALSSRDKKVELAFVAPECNTLGIGLLGGISLEEALSAAERGDVETVIIVENDLYRRAPRSTVDAFLGNVPHVLVIDHVSSPTVERADLLLPAASFAESEGTWISSQGRAQRFFRVLAPGVEELVRESWRWIGELAEGRHTARGLTGWRNLDELVAAAEAGIPALAGMSFAAPSAAYRRLGRKIPREPERASGRTAIRADVDVREPPVPQDPDSALAFSMEGASGEPPAGLVTHFYAPGWSSEQSVNKFQEEIGGPLRGGDAGRRLIEPRAIGVPPYFERVPPPFRRRLDAWWAVPLHHVFGSEELSALARGIRERMPEPYVALSAGDAERLDIEEGDVVEVRMEDAVLRLPVRLRPALAPGVAGLPSGLPGLERPPVPGWCAIVKEGRTS